MENTQNAVLSFLSDNLSQSEAAMIAVLAAHKAEDAEIEGQVDSGDSARALFWRELEVAMVDSIAKNDGKVVYWIGQAAKQINPLLS